MRGANARVAALRLLEYFSNSKVCQFDHVQHLVATKVPPEQYVCTNHSSAVGKGLEAAGGANCLEESVGQRVEYSRV